MAWPDENLDSIKVEGSYATDLSGARISWTVCSFTTCLHRLLFMSFSILESALLCRRRVGWRKYLARIQETKVQFLSQAYWENLNKSLPPSLMSRLLLSKIQVMIVNSFLRSPQNIKSATARYIFFFFITKNTAYWIPTRHQCDIPEGTRWKTYLGILEPSFAQWECVRKKN